jgi:hypothetical protein
MTAGCPGRHATACSHALVDSINFREFTYQHPAVRPGVQIIGACLIRHKQNVETALAYAQFNPTLSVRFLAAARP